jgi:hypothetical protein
VNSGRVQGGEKLMSSLRRRLGPFAEGRLRVRFVFSVVVPALLFTAILWGQILSKEYIRLNGRTLAVEVIPPTVTMLNVAQGGSYPIHTAQQTISFRVDSAVGVNWVDFYLDNLWDGNRRVRCFILAGV